MRCFSIASIAIFSYKGGMSSGFEMMAILGAGRMSILGGLLILIILGAVIYAVTKGGGNGRGDDT